MQIDSKLPNVGTNIFSIMSGLAAKHNAVNLSQGFPNFQPSDRLQRLVFEAMQNGSNQYAPMAGLQALRDAIAHKFDVMYGLKVDANTEITLTAGATQAIFTLMAAFVRPGDEVIMIEPCYDSYAPSVCTVGGTVVPYRLSAPDYAIDWTAIRSLVTPKTKMICINTPNNPTGKNFTSADIDALAELLEGTDIILFSDEVYEHLVYDGKSHQSALLHPKLRARTIATYSFGKTFHNTGWKVGYAVAPPALTKEFQKVHQFNVFSVNHPAQQGLSDFLENPNEYLSLPAFYQEKRDIFLAAMKSTRFKAIPCEGTYFALFDYSDISDLPDKEFCVWLTEEHGVAAIPVSAFYSDGQDDKVIRFCFAKTEDVLLDAVEQLKQV